jgi:predicted nucleic acid-binding protein
VIWYADASFLVSAFGEDGRTAQAKRWLGKCRDFPILVTRLSILEAETALRAAVAGKRLTASKMEMTLEGIHRAMLEGYLVRREVTAKQWFPQAHRISAHAEIAPVCRALDVLHVAAAVVLKANGFLSFDTDQKTLADFEGLTVGPN